MLCRECEEFRFPSSSVVRPARRKQRARQSKNSLAVPAKVPPETFTCSAAGSQSVKEKPESHECKHRTNTSSSVDTSLNDTCPRCFEATDSRCLTCDICRDSFHGICTGLQAEVYDIFLKISSDVGWVCADCRATCRSKLHTLQSSISRTNEELSTQRTLIAELKCELDSVKASSSNVTVCDLNVIQSQPKVAVHQPRMPETNDVSLNRIEISKVLHDINRRKSNVVISGLPEPSGNDSEKRAADLNLFSHLCEEHLDIKPSVSRLGCKRLGKPADFVNKPRKLLVYLNSDAAATELLKSAKLLRRSDDPFVAAHVFFNPDLSPADSKIAFEKRERTRRLRAHKRDTVRVEGSQSVESESESDATATAIISSADIVTNADQPESKSQQLAITAQIKSDPAGPTSVSDPSSHPVQGSASSSFR